MKHWFNNIKHRIRHRLPFFKKNNLNKNIDYSEIANDEQMAWWGTFSAPEEQSRYTKIGNIVLCVDRYNQEWRITHHRETPKEAQSSTMTAHLSSQQDLILKPLLPDRPLLFFLENPLFLPAKSSIPLYLNAPVFVRLELGPASNVLEEMPSTILSDTWFGMNTLTGELCYAVKHAVVHRLDELSKDNTHAIIALTLINQSPENILVKELKIPAPYLSIFSDQQNHLWTEQLTVTFLDSEVSDTLIQKGAPKGLKPILSVSSPRYNVKTGFISLFNP